jgi:CRP-like cAMP-binding protein
VTGQPKDETPNIFVQSMPGSFADLGPLGREVSLDPGAVLWKEGDPGDHVVFLREGRLEVSHQTPDGEEITIRHLYPGAVAGEMAALDGQARSATVRAHSASRLLLIPAVRFRDFLRQRPDLLEQLFWLQVERVRSLTWRVSRTHHRAITDPLTSLYNYGFFRERLAMELERAQLTGDPVALAMFDIDHFKHYNDSHGHQEGNRVLQKVRSCCARPAAAATWWRATGARSSWRSSTAPPPPTAGASRRRSARPWPRRASPASRASRWDGSP